MNEEKMTLARLETSDLSPEQKKVWLKFFLNQPPPEQWLKDHPMAKMKNAQGQTVAMRYLPIDKMEWLVDKFYLGSQTDIKSVTVAANSMLAIVTVRLLNPITGLWEQNDGTGAACLQTDSGKGAIDFNFLKSSSVQMAAPAAVTYAKKDALEQFGRIFGRDINHNGIVAYDEPKFENAKMTEK
jgi:hypothetical protein